MRAIADLSWNLSATIFLATAFGWSGGKGQYRPKC